VGSRIRDHVPLRKCRFVENKTRRPPIGGSPSPTLIHGHALCLSGKRPSSAVHHFGDYEPCSRAPLLRFAPVWVRARTWRRKIIRHLSSQEKQKTDLLSRERSNCALISTTLRGYSRADDRSAEFFARQIKEKTGTEKKTRKKALEREKAESDSNHVPTSVDAYTDDALNEWFEDKDIATGLQLSLNKNRLTSLGSNFTDYKKLGFKDKPTTQTVTLHAAYTSTKSPSCRPTL